MALSLFLLHRFAKSFARAAAIASGVGLLAGVFCIAPKSVPIRWKVDGHTHDLHALRPFQEIVEVLLYRSLLGLAQRVEHEHHHCFRKMEPRDQR